MCRSFCVVMAAVLATMATSISAQNLDLPKGITLKYTIDYATYEPYVAKCVNWLESTPFDQDKDKHTDACAFLFSWVNGAPNVHVDIQTQFMNLKLKKNFPLLVIYMGEWSLYELKNGDKSNPPQAALQAVRAVIKVYKKGNGVTKDKSIEKLIALDEKGQLEKFVTAALPKSK